jgi:pilus assembly protein CpaF
MESVSNLAQKTREVLSSSQLSIDLAIARVLDEAFETSQNTSLDEGELKRNIRSSLIGLGSLEALFAEADVEEIWINSPQDIFISRQGISQKIELELSELEVRQVVEKMLRDSGRRLDRSEPFVDATLNDGSRLHVVIPDVTRSHWAVNIRKFPKAVLSLKDLVELGSLSFRLSDFLRGEFNKGTNILVSGATQAGKTTMLCALLDIGCESERLISVEETFEIRTNYLDWVALQARQPNLEGVGEIPLRRLVREALRMRPTRLVVGEVRQGEALDLLIALNSGIAGLCTIHANSAFEALEKLKLLPLLAGENIPAKFVQDTVQQTIGLVVHCVMDKHGARRVGQVIKNYGEWREVKL